LMRFVVLKVQAHRHRRAAPTTVEKVKGRLNFVAWRGYGPIAAR
jgi:hypothetical protein